MISMLFSEFYKGTYKDIGYELYLIKDSDDNVMYIGISRDSIWHRWFEGMLPVFARHDKGAGKKIKSVTTTTIRNIINERVNEFLGPEVVGKITPHTFLHYFVTTILRGSGNLKLAQELARHSNIQVTQRYAHLSDDELDKGYYDIFEKSKS